MKRATNGVIRRAQLIAPFGVGAMTILADGTSVIAAGLDHWFSTPEHSFLDETEFDVSEWRLQQQLKVSGFKLPPDYRSGSNSGGPQANIGLTVPYLRFPTWSFCPMSRCKRLEHHPLSMKDRPECPDLSHADDKYPSRMVQVSFVAICEDGHIMDFPWRQWVHRSISTQCDGVLRLLSTGGGTLDGQRVTCSCDIAPRTLRDVTMVTPNGSSRLSTNLEPGVDFLCEGLMPWHGQESGQQTSRCGTQVQASLRGASNVYFAQVASSIYLPEHTDGVRQGIDLLSDLEINSKLSAAIDFGVTVTLEQLRIWSGKRSTTLSDDDLQEALNLVTASLTKTTLKVTSPPEVSEQDFRRPEYQFLRDGSEDRSLRGRSVAPEEYGDDLSDWLMRVTLVDRLRETRALWGFSRVHATPPSKERGKSLLRTDAMNSSNQWLPAYKVYGEGIYLEFDEGRLSRWESRQEVVDHVRKLVDRAAASSRGGSHVAPLTARLVLLHTFAHVLINQLIFECGYSSASLRERLFVSQAPGPMAGILVYTASGDSEGTMGGLVRMARPGRLEAVLRSARENASWCAADPVCMELGESGQGPESCNMAACHSCALLPETACEEFNRFLDRGTLVGTVDQPAVGFFN
ncbi:DrmB family protein [Lentzea chajnantorensis]